MIDQITNYEQCLSESVKAQRHPFIGEALKAMFEHQGLTLTHFRNGTPAEDKLGGDIMCKVRERTREQLVDLKLSNGAKAQRIAVEYKRGINQLSTPWSIDESKATDFILWLNTSERWAAYARKKPFTESILSLDNETRAMLFTGMDIVKTTDAPMGRFQSKCTLINRTIFNEWATVKGLGGVLL